MFPSLLIARVKFEPESRVKFESGSVSGFLFSFSFLIFVYILISLIVIIALFFHNTRDNDVLTAVRYIIHQRDIFPVNAIVRVHSQQRPKTNKIFPRPLK